MSECNEVLAKENKGLKICGLIPGQLVKPKFNNNNLLALSLRRTRECLREETKVDIFFDDDEDLPCKYCHSGFSHKFIV